MESRPVVLAKIPGKNGLSDQMVSRFELYLGIGPEGGPTKHVTASRKDRWVLDTTRGQACGDECAFRVVAAT